MFAHPFLEIDFQRREEICGDFRNLGPLIDATLLKPDFRSRDIVGLCELAVQLDVRAVCVPPAALQIAGKSLAGSGVHLCSVVGFPLGFSSTAVKCYESKRAVFEGAVELDIVQNISMVKEAQWSLVFQEMNEIVKSCEDSLVKLILECSLLLPDEIVRCCEIAFEAGCHMIKTSTGFGSRGASLEDINLISSTLDRLDRLHHRRLGIKASGGIKDKDFALSLVRAGSTRIGTSTPMALI